jgi:predicted dehydrogenase
MGVMGKLHAATLAENKCVNLAAVCLRDRAKTENLKLACEVYDDYQQMLQNANLDMVIVATPHRQHKEFCIAAIQSGKHVICEKPMATTVADATEMVEAAKSYNVHLAVMSQTRFEPSYCHLKQLLDSGEMGEVYRCSITETFWRPDSYYRSADWRGTWAGEGGGVLMNQAPHVIDRYLWLCGAPDEVTAVCDTTLHKIEVEDTANMLLRHRSGLQGYIHVNTTECPPLSRLEIICDRGRISVVNGAITVERLHHSIQDLTFGGKQQFPRSTTESIGGCLSNWSPEMLHTFYEDFANAVWHDRPLEVSVRQTLGVVEIINAAQLSSWQRKSIPLPFDPRDYDAFQQDMIHHVRTGKIANTDDSPNGVRA